MINHSHIHIKSCIIVNGDITEGQETTIKTILRAEMPHSEIVSMLKQSNAKIMAHSINELDINRFGIIQVEDLTNDFIEALEELNTLFDSVS
jgi:hypothetical protein